MKRIAFVTEGKRRLEYPAEAKEFYRVKGSPWVNSALDYLEVSGLPEENCFFLSWHNHRIIPFTEEISPYPVREGNLKAAEKNQFADKILDFVLKLDTDTKPIVDIHAGKDIYVPLKKKLEEYGYTVVVHATEKSLGQKSSYYKGEIEKLQKLLKKKEINRGAYRIVHAINEKTPEEAKSFVEKFEEQASLYDMQDRIQTLKDYLKKHYKRNKEATKALNDFETELNKHPEADVLYDFVKNIETLSVLMEDLERFEMYKSKFGKELAKYIRYLIKKDCAEDLEMTIRSHMRKLQIATLQNIG